MADGIELRPATADDDALLFSIYCHGQGAEFAALPLPDEQRERLLRTQFEARERQYRERFPAADFDIVLHNAKAIGCLYALRGPDEFVLIDITILPGQRGRGVASRLVSALIDAAKEYGKPVKAHVFRGNPAWTLWQKLGFEEVGGDDMYRRIEVPAGIANS